MSLDIYVIKPVEYCDTKILHDRRRSVINFLTKEESDIFNSICEGSAVPETPNTYYDFHNYIKTIHKSDDTPQCKVDYEIGTVTYSFWNDLIGYYDIIEPLSSVPFLDVSDKYKACYIDLNEEMYLEKYDFKNKENPFSDRFICHTKFDELISHLEDEPSEYWKKRLKNELIIWMDY